MGIDGETLFKGIKKMATATKKGKKTWHKPWDMNHSNYGVYDTKEGYGLPSEWAAIFEEIWSQNTCLKILKEKTPFDVLGVKLTATWEECKNAFKNLVRTNHPDKGGEHARCQEILAAYSVLKERFGQ